MEYKTIFDEFSPYNCGYLKVDDIHSIYFEESGNKNGAAVVFVWWLDVDAEIYQEDFLDPTFYRIITIDQKEVVEKVNHF